MTSIINDRRDGLSAATAVKGPCVVATTSGITLSGEQTIDGVAVVAGDRVLVKNQTSGAENGIYIADTGSWVRSKDFENNNEVFLGTRVWVSGGNLGPAEYALTTAGTINIGTTILSFAITASVISVVGDGDVFATLALAQAYAPDTAPVYIRLEGYTAPGDGGGALYKQVGSEPAHLGKFSITLSDTITVVWYELAEDLVTPAMFGAVRDGATDDRAAFVAAEAYGKPIDVPPGTYVIASNLTMTGDYRFSGGILSPSGSVTLAMSGAEVSNPANVQCFGVAGDVTGLVEADVRWFGAVTGAADQSTAFQKTYNAATTTFVREDGYTLTAGIDCNLSNREIRGQKHRTGITLGASASADVFRISADEQVFEDFFFTGDKSQTNWIFRLKTSLATFRFIYIRRINTFLCNGFIADEDDTESVTNLYVEYVYHSQPVGQFALMRDCLAFIFFNRCYPDYVGITGSEFNTNILYMSGNAGASFEEVELSGGDIAGAGSRDGFVFDNNNAIVMRRCKADTLGGRGFIFTSCTFTYITNARSGLCDGNQFTFDTCNIVQITDIYAQGRNSLTGSGPRYGVYIVDTTNASLSNIFCTDNTEHGMLVDSSTCFTSRLTSITNGAYGYVVSGTAASLVDGANFDGNSTGNYILVNTSQHLTSSQIATGALVTNDTGPSDV